MSGIGLGPDRRSHTAAWRAALIGLTLTAILVGTFSTDSQGAAAGSAATTVASPSACTGFEIYRSGMLEARAAFDTALRQHGLDKPQSAYTPDDWRAYTAIATSFRAAIGAIAPPDWARRWHRAVVNEIDAWIHLAAASVSRGYAYGNALWGPGAAAAQRERATVAESLAEGCPEFRAIADAWSRASAQATPVPGTPPLGA